MISSLIKSVMAATGLKQSALAELMGVPLDRVKSLATGKVKKLTQGEGEALVRKLNVRAEWLVTGDGPMFQESQERELQARVEAVQTATKKASMDGLSRDEVSRLQELLFFVETNDVAGVRRAMAAPPTDEQMLLDAYRAMDVAGKKALLSAALGAPTPMPGRTVYTTEWANPTVLAVHEPGPPAPPTPSQPPEKAP